MTSKKVLFIIDSLQTGGAEKSLLEICSGLKGIRPIVCTLYLGDDLLKQFRGNGIEVHQLNSKKKYGFLEAFNWLNGKVRKLEPDLMVASLLRSELISRLVSYKTSTPLIGMIVSDNYSKMAISQLSPTLKFKVLVFRYLNRFTSRFSDCYIANSEAIIENNSKALNIPKSKIKVIHRGRHAHLFPKKENNSKEETYKFLSVGRLVPAKDHSFLLKAIAFFKERTNIKFELTIAGEGPLKESLIQQAKNLKLHEVNFIGNALNVSELMRNHDVLLFTSVYEGFSGVIIESMFSGIAILCSDIAANKEAVVNEESALIYQLYSFEDFNNKLKELIFNQSLRLNLIENARVAAVQYFEWKKIIERHESLYLEVISKSS